MTRISRVAVVAFVLLSSGSLLSGQTPPADAGRLDALKRGVAADVDGMRVMTQQMTDMVFSFGELGFQEIETSKYLTGLLRKNGFTVTEGVAGIPTAWVATWGSGKPVIALGSDIDGIPQASQKPGVAYRVPLVEGAPGHGEGHNSGQPLNITAAIAIKKIMERDHLSGTIKVWPGVAEEQLAGKAPLVRAGVFSDVDVCIFTHVGDNFDVSWGAQDGTGLISAQFDFLGEASHAAGAPWRGRSALDAVELMDIGWNFRREHLRQQTRVHYVIRDGGDQPNVVPRTASVWYYFRETTPARIRELFELGNTMANAAAQMASVKVSNVRIIGSAWPNYFNQPVARAAYKNAQTVGLPTWSEDDQTLAKALQTELKVPANGLATKISDLHGPVPDSLNPGGGSDDIGDVAWSVPTVHISYPSNIPNTPGHSWASAVAMATPIAHKGATAGAKVVAMTMLDLLGRPALVDSAWTDFRQVQTKDEKYVSFLRPEDQPAIELNAGIMARYREKMKPFYYDPTKYRTYLEQLGIKYPTVR